ncbi:MAG: GNAT family N-acetyltransferase [Planctomycetaceae bacterium]|nr:GNAT family N-acetyltransferase [Planctomycetaceae bacterium]
MPTLTTPRLKLVPWREEDLDALHQLWVDPAVRRYLLDDRAISRDEARTFLVEALEVAKATGVTQWTIRRLAAPDELIGFAGLRWLDAAARQPELMYGLDPRWWGQGLATEAALAVIDDAFTRLGFQTVWASTDAPNRDSVRVMERLGMTPSECPWADPKLVVYRVDRGGPQ